MPEDSDRVVPAAAPPVAVMPPAQAAPQDPMSLAAAHERLARIVLGEQPLGGTLRLIAQIAVEHLPGVDEASITLVANERPRTVAFSGRNAALLDERQYEQGYGPCLHAAASGTTIAVDMAGDDLYPAFSRQAVSVGITNSTSVALPLMLPGQSAALNLYGRGAPLDPVSRDAAVSFAGYVAVALTNAAVLAGSLTQVENLRLAMASRATIEQAKGIVMAKRGCTDAEAFRLLREASNESNVKLRDIAQDLVNSVSEPVSPRPGPGGRHTASRPLAD